MTRFYIIFILFGNILTIQSQSREVGMKSFEVSNHLNNITEVVNNRKIAVANSATLAYSNPDIISFNDYYPYGMQQDERSGSNTYRYGFQGQEKDEEVKGKGNSINYKYRMHDTRVGRFFAVDPLAKKYPFNSQYTFSENRVLDGVEFEGLEVTQATLALSTSQQAMVGFVPVAFGGEVFVTIAVGPDGISWGFGLGGKIGEGQHFSLSGTATFYPNMKNSSDISGWGFGGDVSGLISYSWSSGKSGGAFTPFNYGTGAFAGFTGSFTKVDGSMSWDTILEKLSSSSMGGLFRPVLMEHLKNEYNTLKGDRRELTHEKYYIEKNLNKINNYVLNVDSRVPSGKMTQSQYWDQMPEKYKYVTYSQIENQSQLDGQGYSPVMKTYKSPTENYQNYLDKVNKLKTINDNINDVDDKINVNISRQAKVKG